MKNEIKTIWDHSDAKAFTTSLASEVNPLISQLDILAGLFGAGGAVQPELNTRVPEAFHVPLDEIANTQIELPRTSRVVGDRITLRGTVLGADDENNEKKPLASSVSSFEVERFGYRADLVPGVVLVKPDQHAEVKNFLFAPTLSWLHKYSPRPDQNGALSRINRLLQPAVGIHAIFLPFDIQETLAVGLGATVSVWGDILVGGVGYNLMARHKDEGQIYYFMGTSLIPLLQTLGFGKNQGAGIK